MKIIHCECGLGNQMCYYANFLAVKKSNPNDEYFFETMLFDIPEMNEIMNMWNGYELKSVFNIDVPNIKDLFQDKEYNEILEEIKKSEFWNNGWYSSKSIITKLLKERGVYNGDICVSGKNNSMLKLIMKYRNTAPIYYIRTALAKRKGSFEKSTYKKCDVFKSFNDDKYYCDMFSIIKPNSGIDDIRDELLEAFKFPEFDDDKNKELSMALKSENSVSIHVRKSDCYKYNADCFKFGYFKRAVEYIKQNVKNPLFVIFSDDEKWVVRNLNVLDLTKSDNIHFVNWNNAENSYRDMQLMSMCKHNISTNSTFGFWASFLNQNPNKITCSPKGSFDTTNWF